MPDMDKLLNKGKLTDEYSVGKYLGAGAFSTVQMVTHKKTKQQFAAKFVDAKNAEFSEENLASEIHYMQRVGSHPNIVEYKAGYKGSNTYDLVMERMTGGELFDIIVQRTRNNGGVPYTEQGVASVMAQVMGAVAHCHKNGIAHRDLKPENLLTTPDAGMALDAPVKLADFGLSGDCTGGALMHEPCGTPEYVAPEVITRYKQGYTEQCDVWSIGVIMYVLLCGYAPFSGSNPTAVLSKVKKGRVAYPGGEWQHISKEAKNIVESCLQLEPKMRPTVAELLESEWLNGNAPKKVLDGVHGNLKVFNARRKLKAAVQLLLMEKRMERAVLGLRVEALLRRVVEGRGGESLEDAQKVAQAFRLAGTASVDKAAFCKILTATLEVEGAMAEELFTAYRLFRNDDESTVRYKDFCQSLCAMTPADISEKKNFAFGLYDEDGSGQIDLPEFSNLLANLTVAKQQSEQFFARTAEQLFKEADTDGDSMISRSEWMVAVEDLKPLNKYFESVNNLHGASDKLKVTSKGVRTTKNRLAANAGAGDGDDGAAADGGCCVIM